MLLRYVVTARESFLFHRSAVPEKNDPQLKVFSLGEKPREAGASRERLSEPARASQSGLGKGSAGALRSAFCARLRPSCTMRRSW